MRCPIVLLGLVTSLATIGPPIRARADAPIAVEPTELSRRTDLVGREVEVDDRVSFFQFHRDEGFDEISLKRSPDVVFWLPKPLRPATNPQPPAIRIRGILQRDGNRVRVEVTGFDLMPNDLDRLNAAVATLSKLDHRNRGAWIQWAERRAASFKDDALLKRAREIEAEGLRTEADRVPPGTDPGRHWLSLADRARSRQISEPEPGALAHRGMRALLAEARSKRDLEGLVQEVRGRFPRSLTPNSSDKPAELESWIPAYDRDPAAAYRSAPVGVRTLLDRRLVADVLSRWFERRAADEPAQGIEIAREAASEVSDRPALVRSLFTRALENQAGKIGTLTRQQVARLGALYKEQLGQPEKAGELTRLWLDTKRRTELAAKDAGGRLRLAEDYEVDLGDRATAIQLLREAAEIDPSSKEVDLAFRSRGFRKSNGTWVESTNRSSREVSGKDRDTVEAASDAPTSSSESERIHVAAQEPEVRRTRGGGRPDSLLGASAEQVRSQFGLKPDRRSWSASQGQVTEQWVFSLTDRETYVTFATRPGERHSRVISVYSLPRRSPGDRFPRNP
ncbi:MAG: hypothetical protein U0794_04810 [Isosphaeraceae bacterium]